VEHGAHFLILYYPSWQMHRVNERIDAEFQAMQARLLLVSDGVAGVLDAQR
jgi:Arc/MetJ family transcription regulator